MTDNEIIKALKCCSKSDTEDNYCDGCPYEKEKYCASKISKDSLDLINRLQAENERLKINLKAVLNERTDHTEAIKEFAERYAENFIVLFNLNYGQTEAARELRKRIVKEMVGDGNA